MKSFLYKIIKNHSILNFEINLPHLILLSRVFYGVLFINFYYYQAHALLQNEKLHILYVWPLKWIQLFDNEYPILLGLFILGAVSSLMCVIWPQKRIFRFFAFLFFLICLSYNFSKASGFSHSYHSVLFASFWLVFMNLEAKELLTNYRNKFYLLVIHLSVLGTYFLSGLWKIRGTMKYFKDSSWTNTKCLESNVAVSYIWNKFNSTDFQPLFLDFLEASGAGTFLWVSVILLQFSAIGSSFFPNILKFYGLMLILFHAATYLLMHISFSAIMYIILIFIICHPYTKSKNKPV